MGFLRFCWVRYDRRPYGGNDSAKSDSPLPGATVSGSTVLSHARRLRAATSGKPERADHGYDVQRQGGRRER